MKDIKKIRIYVLLLAVVLTILWSAFCIGRVMGGDTENKKVTNDKAVDSSNIEDKYLDNNLNISLTEKDNDKETIMTLDDVKEKYNIDGKVTKEDLDDVMKKEGYIEDDDVSVSNEIFYKQLIKPNKYYIREYNGYLAIYRSNDNCQLAIEDEDADIYLDAIMYNNLSQADKEYFDGYKAEFENKEEARDCMTQFIS